MTALNPSKLSNKYMFVFFDTERTQDLEKFEGTFERVPNFTCAQQMCAKCGAIEDMNIDCEQCGKRLHVLRKEPIGKFIDHLRLSRPFADKICYFSQLLCIRHTVSVKKISGTEMDT